MDKTIDLQVVISAVDEASATLENIQKSAGTLGKQFTVVGGILAGALGLAVKAASDAQTQIAKVDATLQSMGKAGLEARGGILKAADATLKLGFDNEEAAVSITKMFQRTGNLTDAIKLNNLAMDLARAKSIDLTTANMLVNQVLSGNGKVLKQYGIDIKETATPLEALGLLQKQVAGQSTAFAKTFAGASAVLKQQIGELSEKIGAQLLPILSKIALQVTPFIEKIIAWSNAHPQLTQNIVLATAALAGLLLVLGPVLIAISMISAPMLIAGAVIGALSFAVFELVKNWQEIKIALEPVLAQAKEMASVVGEFLKPAVDFLVASLKILWSQLQVLWQLIEPVLLPALRYLAMFLGATLVGAIAILIVSVGLIATAISAFIGWLKALQDILTTIFTWFTVGIPTALNFLVKAWDTAWNTMKSTVDAVVGFIQSKIDAVINAWNKAQALVSAPIQAATSAVKSVVSNVVSAVAGKRASGGNVNAGSSYLVGERGAEVFTPNTSGFITPNGGGGITVNINGGTYLSENVAVQIGDMIVNRLKMVTRLRV